MFREFHSKDIIVIVVVVAAIGGYLLWDRFAPAPQNDIREILKRMTRAAESGNARTLLAELAPEYKGELADRADLIKLAERYFGEYGPTKAEIHTCTINVRGELALADVSVTTKAAQTRKWGADGAQSVWRLSFAKYGVRWYVEDIVPMSFMGHDVESFNFRKELRKVAEAALAEAEEKMARDANRAGMAEASRIAQFQQRRAALMEEYPVEAPRWVLDDFEDGKLLWSSQDWGHPCRLSVVDHRQSKRLKAVVSRSAKEKAAFGRPVLLDFTSRDRILVDVENLSDSDVQVAFAVMGQGRGGRFTWYESRMKPVAKGRTEGLGFELRAKTYKATWTSWEHRARIARLDGIGRIFFLVYTNRPGVFHFDNVIAVSDGPKKEVGAPRGASADAVAPKQRNAASETGANEGAARRAAREARRKARAGKTGIEPKGVHRPDRPVRPKKRPKGAKSKPKAAKEPDAAGAATPEKGPPAPQKDPAPAKVLPRPL